MAHSEMKQTRQHHGGEIVVIYVSHIQVFSEPIRKDFERDAGDRSTSLYDIEQKAAES